MKFSEYDIVLVLKDYPENKIKKGDIGVIVMIYTIPNLAYEVEVSDENGNSKINFAIPESELNLVTEL